MKKVKIIVVILVLTVVGLGTLIGVNIVPEGATVGTVIGNAIDGAISDVVDAYETTSDAVEDASISVAGAYETAKNAVVNSVDTATDFLGGLLCDAGNWLKKAAE